MIPLFDLQMILQIDASKFNEEFGFVQTGNRNKSAIVIAFAVLTAFFFLMGIIATIVYCIKKSK